MKLRYKVLLLTISTLLVASFSLAYAYYEYNTTTYGIEDLETLQTVKVDSSTLELEGLNTPALKGIYPGHKSLYTFKVTATGKDNITYDLLWVGSNTLDTSLNYSIYRSNSKIDPNNTYIECLTVEEGGTTKEYHEQCISHLDALNSPIISGSINNNSNIKLKTDEIIQATKEGQEVYYYLVIEYPNLPSNQTNNGSYQALINIEATNINE